MDKLAFKILENYSTWKCITKYSDNGITSDFFDWSKFWCSKAFYSVTCPTGSLPTDTCTSKNNYNILIINI